jgi:hypothetical protein
MWHAIDGEIGEATEEQLRRIYWRPLIRQGAIVRRFDGTANSARHIIGQLLGQREVVLQIQNELCEPGMRLKDTSAGRFIGSQPRDDDGVRCALEHELGAEFKEKTSKAEGFLRGFFGILYLIVGLGNIFVEIGLGA